MHFLHFVSSHDIVTLNGVEKDKKVTRNQVIDCQF